MDGIPWDQVKAGDLDALQVVLLSSSTSRRLRALQELRDRNGSVTRGFKVEHSLTTYLLGSELSPETHQDILELLFRTYPLYVDRSSRQTVQQCLRSLLRNPNATEHLRFLTQKLQIEAARPGLASTFAFVLVEWCCILLQQAS